MKLNGIIAAKQNKKVIFKLIVLDIKVTSIADGSILWEQKVNIKKFAHGDPHLSLGVLAFEENEKIQLTNEIIKETWSYQSKVIENYDKSALQEELYKLIFFKS